MSSVAARTAQIRAGLSAVRTRIDAACTAAERDPAELTLIVVTKTFPADDIRRLAELGVTDVGENRLQEFGPKRSACADLPLRWHFVGQLQTNKAGAVAERADVVHSVDRSRLVHALERGAAAAGRQVTALVQVDLEEPEAGSARGGAPPGGVLALATEVAAQPHLMLGGVMAVAPLGADPRAAFRRLAEVAAGVRATYADAMIVSAGMSNDLEAAIAGGATHLRIGSAVLGSRPALR